MATQRRSILPAVVTLALGLLGGAACGGRIEPTADTDPGQAKAPPPTTPGGTATVPIPAPTAVPSPTTPAPGPTSTPPSPSGPGTGPGTGPGPDGNDAGPSGIGPVLGGACGQSYDAVLIDQEACPNDSFFSLAEVPRAPATITISAGTLNVAAGMTYVIDILSFSGTAITLGTGTTLAPGGWNVSSGTLDCTALTLTIQAVAGPDLANSCDVETWALQ